MKNPVLYETARRVLRVVAVVDEDQNAEIELIRGTACNWHVPKGAAHGEQYKAICPFCKDKKGHLYLSYLSFARPMVDGICLPQAGLMAHCFRRDCLKDPINSLCLTRMLASCGGADLGTVINNQSTDPPKDPMEIYNVSDHVTLEGIRTWSPGYSPMEECKDDRVWRYLAERRVSPQQIADYKIGFGPVISPKTGNGLNRNSPFLQFPFIQNGALRGIQARCIPEAADCDDPLRWWIHPACRKSTVVYNMDTVRPIGIAGLSEGIFDALAIGPVGVAIFGHTPSEYQRRLLATINDLLLWFPDTDVKPDLDPIAIAKKLCAEWTAAGTFPLGAHTIVLPAKDPGSMSTTDIWLEAVRQLPQNVVDVVAKRVFPIL